MDIELQRQWVEALRSGDYKQGTGHLCRITVDDPDEVPRYCCLGVLCEIHPHVDKVPTETGVYEYFDKYGEPPGYPMRANFSVDFQDRIGLSAKFVDCLIQMNDTHGKTFEEIADFIEEEL